MKVYELINQLKGTSATLEQIKKWSYMNRIEPCALEDGLDLDCEYPQVLADAALKSCAEKTDCYVCLNTFFDTEIEEQSDE